MPTLSNRHRKPYIQATPEVCGGVPCIGETRIPVWLLEQARRHGATASDLVADYPILRGADIRHTWAYARLHASEIDRQIHENEAD